MLRHGEAGLKSYFVAASVLSIAVLSQTTYAQMRPKAQPPTGPAKAATPPAPPSMAPLDARRTAYLDDRSGVAGASENLRKGLRERHLWTLTERREAADLIVTLAPTAPAGTPQQNRTPQKGRAASYELSIQSARNAAKAPLWRSVSSSPEALVRRLKADLAPSVCVVVWCR